MGRSFYLATGKYDPLLATSQELSGLGRVLMVAARCGFTTTVATVDGLPTGWWNATKAIVGNLGLSYQGTSFHESTPKAI